MSLSFADTEVAFKHKSNLDLKKSYTLFKVLEFPIIVNYGPKLARFFINMKLPIKSFIKNTVFQQFCGGETIEESNNLAKKLHINKIGSILDYSVEGEGIMSDFIKTFEELKLVINEAANKPEYPFAVFVIT